MIKQQIKIRRLVCEIIETTNKVAAALDSSQWPRLPTNRPALLASPGWSEKNLPHLRGQLHNSISHTSLNSVKSTYWWDACRDSAETFPESMANIWPRQFCGLESASLRTLWSNPPGRLGQTIAGSHWQYCPENCSSTRRTHPFLHRFHFTFATFHSINRAFHYTFVAQEKME